MAEILIINNLWLAVAICAAFYAADYVLDFYETRLYRACADQFLTINGIYNETSSENAEADKSRWLNLRIVVILVILAAGIYALWTLFVQNFHEPQLFSILIGGLILMKTASMMRHSHYIALFKRVQVEGGLGGIPQVSRILYLTLWNTDLLGFNLIYLLAFLVTGSWFFLGGVLACLVSNHQWRDYLSVYKYKHR